MNLQRYSRQIILREVGVNGQQLLRDSSVLIIGVGGLGSVAAQYLVGAGVGRVVLSDCDRVDVTNLQRQTLYRQDDVGRDKLEAARASLAALNSEVEIEILQGPLEGAALARAVRDVDVVLDGTDNFSSRFAINRSCVEQRRPLVSGAAIRMDGQLAVFDGRGVGPCYACLYPDAGENQETCEEAGVLGPVTGVIGSMQALAALKLLLGRRDDVGRLLLWDAWSTSFRSLKITADPQCPVCRSTPVHR